MRATAHRRTLQFLHSVDHMSSSSAGRRGGLLIFRAAGSSRRQQQSQRHRQDSDWTHLGIAIRLVVDIRAWPAIAKFVSDPKVGEKLTLVEGGYGRWASLGGQKSRLSLPRHLACAPTLVSYSTCKHIDCTILNDGCHLPLSLESRSGTGLKSFDHFQSSIIIRHVCEWVILSRRMVFPARGEISVPY